MIIPIFIPHAGCPHQCVFCNQKAISGEKQAAFAAARRQIERWLQWTVPSIDNEAAFYGGSFTGLPADLQQQLFTLTDELLQKKIIGSVRLSTRPDYIDAPRLELLRKHNVRLVELGVQSLDDGVLQAARRGHTAADVFVAVKLLRQYHFQVGLQLMVGLPGQSFDSVKETARLAAQTGADIARIYPLLVIKDTPLAQLYAEGAFAPLSLADAVRQSAYVYRVLTEAGIKVIRVGLQADEELCGGDNILAGPFHPSMGEMVQSFLLREDLTPLLQKCAAKKIILRCPAKMESKVRGLKNGNLQYWRGLLPQKELFIEKSFDEAIEIVNGESNEVQQFCPNRR